MIKLQEEPKIEYQNKTTSYGRSFGMHGDGMQSHQVASSIGGNLPVGAETVSATTTITLNGIL